MKLSDTFFQCLKGLSTQKDETRIRMTIDLWYENGQDPAMLTFNQGAMREHLRLYLQAKSSRRLCSLLNLKFSSHPHCTLLHHAFQELHLIYLYHLPLSCSYPPSLSTYHHMPPTQLSPGASRRNSSLHTTIFGGRIYLHLYRFILCTLFHFYFFQILVLLYFYCSPTLQLFHY